MSKLIFLTDTHLVSGEKLHGLDPKARLREAIADITANHADAAAVFVLGDITDDGEAAAYELAAQLLAKLPQPVYTIPGNHDRRCAMSAVFPGDDNNNAGNDNNDSNDETKFIQRVINLPDATVLLLDTVTTTNAEHHGEFCAQRGQWLQQQLAVADADKPVILGMHHQPLDLSLPEDTIRLHDTQHLKAAIDTAPGKVRFIVCGHGHANISGVWENTPFAMLRSTVHQGHFIMDTNARFAFTHAQPAYGIMLIRPSETVLYHHTFRDNTPVNYY